MKKKYLLLILCLLIPITSIALPTLQIKRGLQSTSKPTLKMGEFGMTTDTHRVFIGISTSKIELAQRNATFTHISSSSMNAQVNGSLPYTNISTALKNNIVKTSGIATPQRVYSSNAIQLYQPSSIGSHYGTVTVDKNLTTNPILSFTDTGINLNSISILGSGTDGTYGWTTSTNTTTFSSCTAGTYGLDWVGGSLYQCKNGVNTPFTSVTALASLTDVSLSTPLTNQLLVYNGTTWGNSSTLNVTSVSTTGTNPYVQVYDSGSDPSYVNGNIWVREDGTLRYYSAGALKTLSPSSGAVTSVFGRSGVVSAVFGDYSASQIRSAVRNNLTINNHPLTSNVTVTASDLSLGSTNDVTFASATTTGTNPYIQAYNSGADPAYVNGNIWVREDGTLRYYSAGALKTLSPSSGTSLLYGNGSGGFSNVTIGANLTFASGTLSASASSGMTNPMTAVGDLIVGGTSGAPTNYADVAAGRPLMSGGVGVVPAYALYNFVGTSAATYSFPGVSKTLAANDGSNLTISGQAIGDIAVASSTTAYGKLADVAVGSVLISGGIGTAPSWSSAPTFAATNLTGTFPGNISGNAATATTAAGLTGVPNISVGTINTTGNITTTGTNPVINLWNSSSDPTAADGNLWVRNGGSLKYQSSGSIYTAANNDGSNLTISGQAIGDIPIASSTTAYGKLADVAVGSALVSGGVGVAPSWSSTPSFTSVTATTFTGALSGTASGNLTSSSTISQRINPRVNTITSSSTPTPAGDTTDEFTVTALAATATFAAPTGTPVDGQKLIIRIKDNTTAQTLAWNAIYRASSDLALPTTTVISKTMYLGFVYNAADTKWDLIAVTQGF